MPGQNMTENKRIWKVQEKEQKNELSSKVSAGKKECQTKPDPNLIYYQSNFNTAMTVLGGLHSTTLKH